MDKGGGVPGVTLEVRLPTILPAAPACPSLHALSQGYRQPRWTLSGVLQQPAQLHEQN